MDDIQQRHVFLAVLAAATVHAVAMTVYLSAQRPATPPPLRPPIMLLRSPPPPAAALPEAPPAPRVAQEPAPPEPVRAPAYDPDLPSVTLRKPPETPVMEEFETVITPLPEPTPPPKADPEPLPEPKPVDLTQFEVPPAPPVPVPRPKPAPPRTRTAATAPVPKASPRPARESGPADATASSATGSPTVSAGPAGTGAGNVGIVWPHSVEQLTEPQKQQLLTEYYVDDKSHWEPWHETREDALRRLQMGFVDPKAEMDEIDYADPANAYLRPPGWDPHDGPLTVQELEETLKKLVAADTKSVIGRDVKSVSDLRYSERQKLLKKHYAKDPRWKIGVVDPKAPIDEIELADPSRAADRPLNWDPHEGPLTVQDLQATLEKFVQLGTQHIIGRNVRSVRELTYGERQDILRRYYKDDPRWKIGVVDTQAGDDLIDKGMDAYLRESPLTIQEVDKTLREMLDRKLRQQDGRSPYDPPSR